MKRLSTFFGGIHPNDNKKYTKDKPIVDLSAPKELVFPLSQHIGAPCNECVKVGDKVYVGTKIADSEAFVSAPVHSSVSGEVVRIEERNVPSGLKVKSIIIENDFQYENDPGLEPVDYLCVKPENIPSLVREAGIVGMGGATFPTHVKLLPPPDKKIDTIIVNGAECEPYLTSDYRVMLETPEEVIFGLKVVLYRFGITNGIIGIEANKPEAIKKLTPLAKKEGMKVCPLKTKYPQGGEKQLIYAVTKRKVPTGGLPADVGVVVLNIDTCTAIARKFLYGTPLTRRIVTYAGSAVKEPTNYRVKLGTTFEYLIESNGGFLQEPKKVIMGGPMMGIAQSRLDVPIIKGTSAILALTEKDLGENTHDPCIKCGKCVDACPMNLMPLYLTEYALRSDLDKCEQYHITDCIECGCCAYLCPSNRHNIQAIRIAKQAVIARQKARANNQGGKK